MQATLAGGLTNLRLGGSGETLSLGADVGVGTRAQIGLYLALPVAPNAGFGTLLLNVQIGLSRLLNLRFDIGAEHASSVEVATDTFLFGVGVPFKWKFHRFFALVGSGSTARAFGPPLDVNHDEGPYLGNAIYGPIQALSDDILVIGVIRRPGLADNAYLAGVQFPIGILFQPHEVISLRVRTGLRLLISHSPNDLLGAGGSNPIDYFIPLSFELVVSPVRRLDIGFTASLPGWVHRSTGILGDELFSSYANLRVFELWLAFHP